jgi:phospholipid/cholesterol/gamma-HCH transport system substrate-binding protein
VSRQGPRVAAFGVVLAMVLSGCGFRGVYSLPLPGAVGTGSDTYTVNVQFADVLDLVPYSAVKVNGATMGHIKTITLQGDHALVVCQIEDAARLPRNAVARVEETSLLGEKYVELEAPKAIAPQGRLVNGDTIALADTDTDASVEEVLGALSALLSGGGIAQVSTIAHELNTALTGRTAVARDLLAQIRTFASGLNAQKADIVRAIQGVDTLARTVKSQENELVGAIEHVPPALHILADDSKGLTTMLVSVKQLGNVAVRVENASQRDLIANLRDLRPTLAKLAEVGDVIPKTLSILITYPTADSVENEYFGDYGNLSLTIDLSKTSLQTLLEGNGVPKLPTLPTPHPTLPALPTPTSLPTILPTKLPTKVPTKLPTTLPTLPPLTQDATHSAGSNVGAQDLPQPLSSITRWVNGTTIADLLTGELR